MRICNHRSAFKQLVECRLSIPDLTEKFGVRFDLCKYLIENAGLFRGIVETENAKIPVDGSASIPADFLK